MKGIKLSKTSWLILAAGVFIVILAGLGLSRSQQLSEQNQLDEALAMTMSRLDMLEVTQIELEEAELKQRLDEATIEFAEVKDRLRQTVVSVDVTDELFRIAEYSNVEITSMMTSAQSSGKLGPVSCLTTSITANVLGSTDDLIDFVINLNSGYTTGIVKSVNISIPEDAQSDNSTAAISMSIYSYEGS
jgi:hypothetical protein